MEFEDSFEVAASPEVAWDVLTDIKRVYPCLPGAELEEVSNNEFRGFVTLRLGPIMAVYHGTARFEDLDPESRTLIIYAEGRDKHGQGMAKARVTARLLPQNDVTRVVMSNQVDITGKAAQFGRGVLEDVSKEILGEFASNLQQVVTGDQGETTTSSSPAKAPMSPSSEAPTSAASGGSISVLALGGRVAARRARESPRALAALALVVGLIALLAWWRS